MNDERIADLIQAELDDRLSDAERGELEALLQDPAARALRDEFHQAVAGLSALSELEPPAALRQALRGALPAAGTVRPANPSVIERLIGCLAPPAVRIAGAFAAGLAVGVVAVGLGPGSSDLDMAALTGTMAGYETGSGDAVDRLTMELPGIEGSIGLHRRGGLYVIEYDLDAAQPVDVVTDYTGTDANFSGFAHIGDSDTRAVAEGRQVRLTIDGHRRYAVFLSRPRGGAGDIEIGLYDGDALLHRDNLTVPAAADRR
jgi:hypothetical protein